MILFFDDEPRDTASYVEELQDDGYQVKFIRHTDEALEFLDERGDEVELLILDIMAPAGERLKSFDTADGVRTGEYFFQETRKLYPTLQVIILTNHPSNGLTEKFANEKYCQFKLKSECFPYQLAELVAAIIENSEE